MGLGGGGENLTLLVQKSQGDAAPKVKCGFQTSLEIIIQSAAGGQTFSWQAL